MLGNAVGPVNALRCRRPEPGASEGVSMLLAVASRGPGPPDQA
jgi:hypothetical protein